MNLEINIIQMYEYVAISSFHPHIRSYKTCTKVCYCVNSLRYRVNFSNLNHRQMRVSLYFVGITIILCVSSRIWITHVVMKYSTASVPKRNPCKILDRRSSERLFCRNNNTALQLLVKKNPGLSFVYQRDNVFTVLWYCTCSMCRIKSVKSSCPVMFQWRWPVYSNVPRMQTDWQYHVYDA